MSYLERTGCEHAEFCNEFYIKSGQIHVMRLQNLHLDWAIHDRILTACMEDHSIPASFKP
jgi:hypothetical protein